MASATATTVARNRAHLVSWDTPAELVRVIVILAVPVAISNALQILLGFVDTRMCAPIGDPALSAMSVGRAGTMFLSAVFMGLGVGVTAYVARLSGAGQHAKARDYATTGVLLGAAIGLVLMTAGLLFGKDLVQMMVTGQIAGALTADVMTARSYVWAIFRIIFLSMSLIGMMMAAVSIFNSLGKTLYPMWLLALSNVANLIGNILLIPLYGVAGSAASTAIMQLVVALVAVYTLWRSGIFRITLEPVVHYLSRSWDLLKIGIPVSVQLALRSMAMLTVIKLITFLPNSVVGQGALQVGLQAESMAFMPAFAFSTAAATLVGQNLGAKRPDQARLSALYCVAGSQLVMWTMGTLLFLYPEAFVKLFIGASVPNIVAPAASFLRIMALCLPGLGLSMTFMGVLRGAGDAAITAVISLAAMWIVRLPLATYLALHNVMGSGHGMGFGLTGIWWAMTLSVYVEAGLAYWRYRTGHWQRVKLKTH